MVPSGWKLTSLRNVCSGQLQTGPFGSQLHAHEYIENGVPVLMPKDLINYRANTDSAAKIPENRANDLSKHLLKEGDILFSRRGDVARFALIEKSTVKSICGTGCLKATPNEKHSSLFLAYFLQKNAVQKWLEQNAVGQTMLNMNTSILSELPLMVASSKAEEDKIAQILSTWDKAISTIEVLIANSQQQKKALMQQLLTGKKRLKGFNEVFTEHKLEELCHFKRGKGLSKGMLASNGKYKCILYGQLYTKYNEVVDNVISRTNAVDSIKSIYGDILIPSSTTTSGIDLANAVALLEDDVLLGGDINILRPDIKKVCPEFLAYLLTHIKKHQIASRAQGITIIHLYGTDLKPLLVHIPTLKEQQRIASVLSSAELEIKTAQEKLTHLKQEKKALMQQLLTGKRRVSV